MSCGVCLQVTYEFLDIVHFEFFIHLFIFLFIYFFYYYYFYFCICILDNKAFVMCVLLKLLP